MWLSLLIMRPAGSWLNSEAIEFAALEAVDGFNNRHLPESIGNIRLAKAVARYDAMLDEQKWQRDSNETASGKLEAVRCDVF
jgi:hypothetical protein